ncbi:hypothetical protein ABZZ20_32375 [Streptomyces sp. NPDC006430]|uniref:hypothetical protein n=1 Tax=Streptomyces sp. NPDC006430 TaxID=3154299 RepID=UPI0033AE11CF
MTPGPFPRAARAAMFAAVCVLLSATGHLLMSEVSAPWWALSAALAGTATVGWALAGRERGLLAVTVATVAVQAVLHAGFSLAQSVLHPSLPAGTPFARQWAEYLTCAAGGSAARSGHGALRAVRVVDEAAPGGLGSVPVSGTAVDAVPEAGSYVHHAGHAMHALHGAAGTASGVTGTAAAVDGHDMGGMSPAGMLAAHLLAAVLCGLWLAYGERAAFRVLRALAGWLRAPLRLLFGPTATPHRPPAPMCRARRGHVLRQLLLVHAITSRGPPAGTAVHL